MTRAILYEFTGSGWDIRHPDFPADDIEWTSALNAPTELTISLGNERPGVDDIVPWLSAFGVLVDGVIRAFGIVTGISADDAALSITCTGVSGYLDGQPWTDEAIRRYDADPGELIPLIWERVQSHRWAALGVAVDKVATGTRVGEKRDEVRGADDEVTEQAVDEPWILDRTETHDLGAEVDALLTEAALESREVVSLTPTGAPRFRLEIAPHIGRRRRDVRAEIGDSVYVVPAVEALADDYASDVLLIGAGEGPDRVVSHATAPRPSRIRRAFAYSATDVERQAAADSEAGRVLSAMTPARSDVSALEVIDSPTLPVWSLEVGDEIFLAGDFGAAGPADMWVRVVAATSSLSTPHLRSLEVVPV